jgi:predicted metalloprotease with PDZ domain
MSRISPHLQRTLSFLALIVLAAPATLFAAERSQYIVTYTVGFLPAEKAADVTMEVRPDTGRASQFTFTMDPARYSRIEADKGVSVDGDQVIWKVPEKGGNFRYRYGPIDHQRDGGGYDARITEDWTILRGDDLFPAAAVRLTKGADSRTRLHFKLPKGWTMVDTGFGRIDHSDSFVVTNAERAFDRPVGWIIAGKVGNRFERIAGVELSVAAPKGSNMHRNDVVAMFTWVLPEMKRAFHTMPNKILIVGADDPMWRGGLSGPNSIYLHSDRPLISGNYTSALVHEMVHIVTRIHGEDGYDWIPEGLAEFYAVELIRRAGGMSDERYRKVRDFMQDWSKEITTLRAENSTAKRTARAVLFFQELDAEIRETTDGKRDLDNVARVLISKRRVDLDDLREASESVADSELESFESRLLLRTARP